MRLGGIHPVIVGAGVFLVLRADEGEVLDAGHVRRMRVRNVAAGESSLVELLELAGFFQGLLESRELGGRAVTPLDAVWSSQLADLINPFGDRRREILEGGERMRRGGHLETSNVCLS